MTDINAEFPSLPLLRSDTSVVPLGRFSAKALSEDDNLFLQSLVTHNPCMQLYELPAALYHVTRLSSPPLINDFPTLVWSAASGCQSTAHT
jgi:hypothetical protein